MFKNVIAASLLKRRKIVITVTFSPLLSLNIIFCSHIWEEVDLIAAQYNVSPSPSVQFLFLFCWNKKRRLSSTSQKIILHNTVRQRSVNIRWKMEKTLHLEFFSCSIIYVHILLRKHFTWREKDFQVNTNKFWKKKVFWMYHVPDICKSLTI